MLKNYFFLNSYFILDEEFQTFLCLIYAQFYLKNIINRCYQIKSYCFLFFAITIISVFNQCMANVWTEKNLSGERVKSFFVFR